MNTNARQQADRILQILERAKYLHSSAALRDIGAVRDEVGSGEQVENERAEAWLALCALHKTLSETPGHRDLPVHWERAIDKTKAWFESIK